MSLTKIKGFKFNFSFKQKGETKPMTKRCDKEK